MTNNDDIVKGDVPPYMNDTLRLFYAELQKGETDYAGMLTRLAVLVEEHSHPSARITTIVQLVVELDVAQLLIQCSLIVS